MRKVRRNPVFIKRQNRKALRALLLQSMPPTPAAQVANKDFYTLTQKHKHAPFSATHNLRRKRIKFRARLLGLLNLVGRVSKINVPNVEQILLSSALSVLGNDGLTARATFVSSLQYPFGIVISQAPVAGTSVAAGSNVQLLVSSGFALMPDLINQSIDTGAITLASLGLVPDITNQPRTDATPGTIVKQEPAAGSPLLLGSSVFLVVATAPPGQVGRAQLPPASDIVSVQVTLN